MGAISLSTVEYEHVIISEMEYANQHFDSIYNTITVKFNNDACPRSAAHERRTKKAPRRGSALQTDSPRHNPG